MNLQTKLKEIVSESAFCSVHPTSPVGRHPVSHDWPTYCLKGFGSFKETCEDPNCQIIVETQKDEEVKKTK